MPIFHAIVLGIAQGLAEFLPISSSGHLELIPWMFGWDDFGGDQDLENTFDVALHVGTLVGAVAYLWSDIVKYTAAGLGSAFRKRPWDNDARIAWFLLVSAVPAAVVGVLLEDLLLDLGENTALIAILLIVFGLLLLFADRLPTARGGPDAESLGRGVDSFTLSDAMKMGVAQACALLPGVSRSGVTITVGRALRFDRNATARIAFLMSLPLIAGAGAYRGLGIVSTGFPVGMASGFAAGMTAAAITGWFAVWGTLKFVRSRTFAPFVAYRVALGVFVLCLLATNVR
ncbi:MAG: undecaprenyl-diphosphate phosphatase [Acidimicrobiales bacterium]|jgi:undecaprenyl-diphosphatase